LIHCAIFLSVILFFLISLSYFFGLDFIFKNQFFLTVIVVLFVSVVLLFDFYGAVAQSYIGVKRSVVSSVAVNRWSSVNMIVVHNFNKDYDLQIYEHLPDYAECDDMPLALPLRNQKKTTLRYRFKSLERGPFVFEGLTVRVPSPLGFWSSQYFIGEKDYIRVYPDFKAITAYTLLATDNHVSQLGIKRKPRRGQGMDFMQLREYRRGDSLRQIDWKASSRREGLISRQYQDERDQQIVVLMDCGRRMRAKDGELIHFDHALNASLLLSYIALRQGDSVGFLTFGGDSRWISPQKGAGRMKNILSNLYDLKTTQVAPDYVSVAEKLTQLQTKRSLIILVTNSRDEDINELLMAAKLLRRQHLVLLANIKEMLVDQIEDQEIKQLDDALLYLGTSQYLQARKEAQTQVKSHGVFMLDCLASELAANVCNSYLEIKRSGLL